MAYPLSTAAQLAVHLRSLRKARGLTQAQLGARIGVKQARMADIERHPGAVSLEQLLDVVHALGARLQLVDASYPSAPPTTPPRAGEPPADW